MRGIHRVYNFLIDCIFPVRCISCGIFDSLVCDSCIKDQAQPIEYVECHVCRKEGTSGLCLMCVQFTALDQVVVLYQYSDIIKNILHGYKYAYIEAYEDIISSLVNVRSTQIEKALKDNSHCRIRILSVPIHRRRFAKRGFNQSDIIAKTFVRHFNGSTISSSMKRVKDTPHLAQLNRMERFQKIQGAFKYTGEEPRADDLYIIVDDVYTSGATMEACANTLRKKGVKHIIGVVLARGVLH